MTDAIASATSITIGIAMPDPISLPRLREAKDYWDTFDTTGDYWGTLNKKLIQALLSAPTVRWCTEHLATLLSTDRETGEQFCWKHLKNFIPSDVPYTPCQFSTVALVSPNPS